MKVSVHVINISSILTPGIVEECIRLSSKYSSEGMSSLDKLVHMEYIINNVVNTWVQSRMNGTQIPSDYYLVNPAEGLVGKYLVNRLEESIMINLHTKDVSIDTYILGGTSLHVAITTHGVSNTHKPFLRGMLYKHIARWGITS